MQRAHDLKMKAVGITEHGNIHGWMDFYDAAKDADVKPILGMEAYQARKTRLDRDEEERAGRANDEWQQRGPHHLTLLARNNEGYRNIIKMSSRAYVEGFYGKPRLDFDVLSDHSEGVIVLSGCLSGKLQQAILRDDLKAAEDIAKTYQSIVGKENFYIEVMRHGIPEEEAVFPHLVELAKKVDARIIPTGDCHYVHRHDAKAHDVMLCVSTGATIDQESRFRFHNEEFYLKSYDEMLERFDPEWLRNTEVLADSVELDLKFGELHFPVFPIPNNESLDSYFEREVWEGVRRRYPDFESRRDVRERVEHELGVVKRMGFQNYFLVVSDIVRWANKNDIRTGYGRGSAAGSILSYALGITGLDPIHFGLLFERFLVEGRKSMPDIDLDFDDRYRDRVIDYVRNKYGYDRVAHICTFTTVGAKTAIRDAARVLGHPVSSADKICSLVPAPVLGVSKTLSQAMETTDMQKEYHSDPISKDILDAAQGLESLVRQSGIHAAGVVVAKSSITDFVPVMRLGDDKPLVTQWDMHRVEQWGMLKIDFLGLRNLRIVDDCVRRVNESYGLNVDVYSISLDDYDTFEELKNGNTIGVFQLESEGMRQMAMAFQPSSIDDIMAIISLYRPGPMGSGMDKMYVSRKHGRSSVEYLHPKLEEILGSRYGIMLYQEDVLAVARSLAGFSAGEADDLRKVIGKKLMDEIPKYRKKFVEGCKNFSSVSEAVANKIYSDIEYFGGYGFNLAHAASYAMMSYVTAYLKVHYPAEYMAALLSSVTKNQDRADKYLYEARRMGLKVSLLSLNESDFDFKVVNETELLFGFSSVAGIGEALSNRLLDRSEPYKTIWDFFRNADTEVLNRKTFLSLLHAGAFDELIPEQEQQIMHRSEKLEFLFKEKETLGFYFTEHPVQSCWHVLDPVVTGSISDIKSTHIEREVVVGGIVSNVVKLTTKRGDPMVRFTVEDLTDRIEVIVFPKQAKFFEELDIGSIVSVTGILKAEGDDETENYTYRIFFKKINHIEVSEINSGIPIYLDISPDNAFLIEKISEIIEDNPGDSLVFVRYKNHHGREILYQFKKPTTTKVKSMLEELVTFNSLLGASS